jgi:hypothetical protein
MEKRLGNTVLFTSLAHKLTFSQSRVQWRADLNTNNLTSLANITSSNKGRVSRLCLFSFLLLLMTVC